MNKITYVLIRKQSVTSLIFTIFFLSLSFNFFAQNVGISSTGLTPDGSALLDIDASGSTPKLGLLIPRMTIVERNAIPLPALSLMIFNTDCNVFNYWDGVLWVAFPDNTLLAPNSPGLIVGLGQVIPGQNGVSYSISPVPGATSYTWTTTPGVTIISG